MKLTFDEFKHAYRLLYYYLDLKESTIKDIVKKIDKKFSVKRNDKNEIVSFKGTVGK